MLTPFITFSVFVGHTHTTDGNGCVQLGRVQMSFQTFSDHET